MDNKVVTSLARAAQQQGLNTLRFNYRGIGNSHGTSSEEKANGDYQVIDSTGGPQGELADVMAAIEYAFEQLGWQSLVLVGFSFGGAMACMAANLLSEQQRSKTQALVLVAPAVHHFDAPNQLPHEFDSFLYMGDADEVVPFDEVEHWAELVSPQPHFQVFEQASHFFHGRLVALKQAFSEDLLTLKPSHDYYTR